MNKLLMLAAIGVTMTTASISHADHSNNVFARIIGAGVGAYVGSEASNGNAGVTVGSAILGSLLFGEIAKDWSDDDERESSRALDRANRTDWREGREYGWNSHHPGNFRCQNEGYYSGLYCRDYVLNFVDNRGDEHSKMVRSCRDGRGVWTQGYEVNIGLVPMRVQYVPGGVVPLYSPAPVFISPPIYFDGGARGSDRPRWRHHRDRDDETTDWRREDERRNRR